jgi:hypothetical protein
MRVPESVRARLATRSGGWCEAALPGCDGRAREVQHRVTVKMGGRRGPGADAHNRLSNLLHVCRRCHDVITSPRTPEPYDLRLCLREHQDPAMEAVSYRGAPTWLADDGGLLPVAGGYHDNPPGGA